MEGKEFTDSQMEDLTENNMSKQSSLALASIHGVNLYYDDLPMQYEVRQEITMTEKEQSIFEFLLQVLKDNGRKTVLRVAGGWVRDKIMGKESDDIDIALDDMYGEEFAEMIRKKIDEDELASGNADSKKAKG